MGPIAPDQDEIVATPGKPVGIDCAMTNRGTGYQRLAF
jgi:hypothetical protein